MTAVPAPGQPSLFGQHLDDLGVTDTRFARLVNQRAWQQSRRELGLARTTVGHWRRGMKPRDPMVAELAAAELSARLGYPLTPADLGWRAQTYERDDLGLSVADTPTDTVRTVAGLTGRDLRRDDGRRDSTPFVPAAFSDVALASLTGVVDRVPQRSPEPPPAATMVRDMTATYRRLADQFGGGQIRSQVVTFLHDRAKTAAAARPDADVFAALSDLVELAGRVAQDGERQGTAQRYYIQALALAEHADDPALAGRALSAMSEHASRLGHRRQAGALAVVARRRTEDPRPTPDLM